LKLIKDIARSSDFDASRSEVLDLYFCGLARVSVALQKGLSKICELGCDLARNYASSPSSSRSNSNSPLSSSVSLSSPFHAPVPVRRRMFSFFADPTESAVVWPSSSAL
jgi:hypothetical protein